MPVIGLLDPRSPDSTPDRMRGFRRGRRDIGFVEGENAAIDLGIWRISAAAPPARSISAEAQSMYRVQLAPVRMHKKNLFEHSEKDQPEQD